jgi:small subunit ribosomal protein S20
MANTISAIKRDRQTQRKTEVNTARKSRFRHQLRELRRLLEKKDAAGVKAGLPQTYSLIDRAVRWGIIKKNTAARYKSRLALGLKSLAAA